MSSTARSTLFGRHAWRSLYESLDSFTSRLSSKQNPATRFGVNQFSSFSSSTIYGRPSNHASWAFPSSPKVYGYRRSFTSGGLLLIGFNPTSSTTSTVVASCTAAADSAIVGNVTQNGNLAKLARQSWQRGIHTGRGRNANVSRRRKSTKTNTESGKATTSQPKSDHSKPAVASKPAAKPTEADPAQQQNYLTNYFHLPNVHLPHRPTKEEFLAATTGFWERLKVRFKWFSIRSMRPWNTDEWGAFLSFFLFGHLVWILVGTTTFMSLVILSINTVFAQGET